MRTAGILLPAGFDEITKTRRITKAGIRTQDPPEGLPMGFLADACASRYTVPSPRHPTAPQSSPRKTSSGYMACRVINATPVKEEVRTANSATPSAAITPAKAPLAVQPTNSTGNSNDWRTPIVQAAAGYQYNSVNGSTNVYGFGFSTNRVNTNGAFAQVMVNVNRYVSPVGNIDFSYKNEYGSNYLLTYLGGIQAYPLSHGRWSPFARAMFGAGTLHVSGYQSETGFSWQVGGGLDWHFGREGRLALRLGTFDYTRTSKNGVNLNSLKVGSGIVF